MARTQSRLTAQGQISVPAQVRRKLGLGAGSVLVWEEAGDTFVVRKGGRVTFSDIHDAVFRKAPAVPATPENVKEGIRKYIRKRHARR